MASRMRSLVLTALLSSACSSLQNRKHDVNGNHYDGFLSLDCCLSAFLGHNSQEIAVDLIQGVDMI